MFLNFLQEGTTLVEWAQVPKSYLLPLIGVVATAIVLLHYLVGISQDPREPPFVPQKFPYVGHLIGILRHGTKYYDILSAKNPLPAYSLAMPRGRTYIINSPDLVMAVQRNAKTLSSAPFAAKYAARVVDLSEAAKTIWFHDVEGESGEGSLFQDGMKAMQASLTPGNAELDHIVKAMLDSFLKPCKELDGEPKKRKVHLMAWLRDELTLAAADAIYGPMNPFGARHVRDGFWDFYQDFTKLLLNVFPTATAAAGYKGRLTCSRAVEDYLHNQGDTHGASGLLKALVNTSKQYGVPEADIARFDILNIQAALANVTPTAFWTIYHIFSSPPLLQRIRHEVEQCITTSALPTTESSTSALPPPKTSTLDIGKLLTTCPLLHSTFQEVLRTRSYNASVRVVLQDTLLHDRYLLKKHAVIHMPSHVMHNDPSIWGPDASTFDPDRFLPPNPIPNSHSPPNSHPKPQRRHPAAFRAFGGGTTLCPGRHFATTTIIAIVAMLVWRYEMVPEHGEWSTLTQKRNHLVAAILPPDQDVEVEIALREEGEWRIGMGDAGAVEFAGADL